MPADVFVSYSRENENAVKEIVQTLHARGVSVWIDQAGIDGAAQWGKEIVRAIKECKLVVVMASRPALASDNVRREVHLAFKNKKPILPLYLEPADVPEEMEYELAGIQHIEMFRHDAAQAWKAILKSLSNHGVAHVEPARASENSTIVVSAPRPEPPVPPPALPDDLYEEARKLLAARRYQEMPREERLPQAETLPSDAAKSVEQLASERSCKVAFEQLKLKAEDLAARGTHQLALVKAQELQQRAGECPWEDVRKEFLPWAIAAIGRFQAAIDAAAIASAAREALAQRQQLEIGELGQRLELGLSRHEYDGLSSTAELLAALCPGDQRIQKTLNYLLSWDELEWELRNGLSELQTEHWLDFVPGDETPARLKQRLQLALKAERTWNEVRDLDEGEELRSSLEKLLWTFPGHVGATRRLKPLYGRRSWNVFTFTGHEHPIADVSFSVDGRRVVSRDASGVSRIWCLATGSEVTPLKNQVFKQLQMCVSPYGDYALSGFHTTRISVWSAKTGQEIGWLEGHTRPVRAMALSPDGKLALSAGEDGAVRVWDLATCRQRRCFFDEGFDPFLTWFSPSGQQVFASGPGKIRIWQLDTQEQICTFDRKSHTILPITCSADMRFLGWIEESGQIALVDVQEKGQILHLGRKENTFCFSNDGEYLVSGNEGNVLTIWSTAAKDAVRQLKGHRYSINCVAFAPDRTRVVSGSEDETVRLWDARSGAEIRTFEGHKTSLWKKMSARYGVVTALAFSPDGRHLASGSQDQTVRVWYASL